MNFKKTVIYIILLCLALTGCKGEAPQRDSLSLWCLDSEPAKGMLVSIAQEYNAQRQKGTLALSIRSFPDEEALSAGFYTMQPDLLVCSHAMAQELSQSGLTRKNGIHLQVPPPEYKDYIYDRIPQCGLDIFPIGGNIQLICAAPGAVRLSEQDKFDLEYLCSIAENYGKENSLPFFTADSFASLFYQALLCEGKEFHAVKDYDIKNSQYREVYNLIADSAYEGGIISSSYTAAELLRSAYLPCAALSSSELSGLSSEGFELFTLEGSDYHLSRLSCFVLTLRPGREADSLSEFLSWIFSGGRAEKLCLKSGLMPVFSNYSYNPDSPLEILLMKLSSTEKLHLPERNCDFLANYKDFENNFRKALELLR